MTDIINDLQPFMLLHRNIPQPQPQQPQQPQRQPQPPQPQPHPQPQPQPQSQPQSQQSQPQSQQPQPQPPQPQPQSHPQPQPQPQQRQLQPQQRQLQPQLQQRQLQQRQLQPQLQRQLQQSKLKDPLLNCLVYLHDPLSTIIENTVFSTAKPFNESAYKIGLIDKLRDPKNKSRLWSKDTKVSTLPTVEANLATEHHLTLTTFITICMLEYVAPFTILYKNSHYRFSTDTSDDDDPADAIKRAIVYNDDGVWRPNTSNLTPNFIPQHEITNLAKPYKAASGYTVTDLRAFCEQLGLIDITNLTIKHTKPQLYELLKNYFAGWINSTGCP